MQVKLKSQKCNSSNLYLRRIATPHVEQRINKILIHLKLPFLAKTGPHKINLITGYTVTSLFIIDFFANNNIITNIIITHL